MYGAARGVATAQAVGTVVDLLSSCSGSEKVPLIESATLATISMAPVIVRVSAFENAVATGGIGSTRNKPELSHRAEGKRPAVSTPVLTSAPQPQQHATIISQQQQQQQQQARPPSAAYAETVALLLGKAKAMLSTSSAGRSVLARSAVLQFEAEALGRNVMVGDNHAAGWRPVRGASELRGLRELKLWEVMVLPERSRLEALAAVLSTPEYQAWRYPPPSHGNARHQGAAEDNNAVDGPPPLTDVGATVVSTEASGNSLFYSSHATITKHPTPPDTTCSSTSRSTSRASVMDRLLVRRDTTDTAYGPDASTPNTDQPLPTVHTLQWERLMKKSQAAWDQYWQNQSLQADLARKEEVIKEKEIALEMEHYCDMLQDGPRFVLFLLLLLLLLQSSSLSVLWDSLNTHSVDCGHLSYKKRGHLLSMSSALVYSCHCYFLQVAGYRYNRDRDGSRKRFGRMLFTL
jgi:hypothetical protein